VVACASRRSSSSSSSRVCETIHTRAICCQQPGLHLCYAVMNQARVQTQSPFFIWYPAADCLLLLACLVRALRSSHRCYCSVVAPTACM
jgi:hypothetical protein